MRYLKLRSNKPEPPDWLQRNVANASKIASKVFSLYLLFLVPSSFALLFISDREIVLNETALLPIVNIKVKLNDYLYWAPLIILFLFIYLQVYIHRVKSLSMELIKNPYYQKGQLYPWVLNIAADSEPGILGFLQKFTVKFLFWWVPMVVFILFQVVALKKHDELLSYYLLVLFVSLTVVVLLSWILFDHNRKIKLYAVLWKIPLVIVTLILTIFMIQIIPTASKGAYGILPRESGLMTRLTTVDLSFEKMIDERKADSLQIYLANFYGIRLEGADLTGTIFIRTDLRWAHLAHALIHKAKFQYADLERADLFRASIFSSNFQNTNLNQVEAPLLQAMSADFSNSRVFGSNFRNSTIFDCKFLHANLAWSNFSNSTLIQTDFTRSNLFRVHFDSSDLQNANFDSSYLSHAYMKGAKNLTTEQLAKALTLHEAELDEHLSQELKRVYPNLFIQPTPDQVQRWKSVVNF